MDAVDLDLNLLKAFEALYQEQHVTRAARRVGISQPAMSASLARLRRASGDELFVRSPNGLSPTPRAIELAEPVAAALAAIRNAFRLRGSFAPSASRHLFRVAASDHPATVLVPQTVERLMMEAPGIDLRMRSFRDRREVVRLLDDGAVDLAIGVRSGFEARILHRPLFEERFVVIARAGTDVASMGEPHRFAALRHILVSPEGEDHGVVDDALAKLGLGRRIAVSVPDPPTAMALVARTDLVATIMVGAVRAWHAADSLVVANPPMTLEPVEFGMQWHRRTDADPAHEWLRAVVAETCAMIVR